MIKVKDYAEGTPERKLAQFYEAWKNGDWEVMARTTQISWIEAMPKAKKMLKEIFQFKLINAELVESRMLNNVAFSAKVKVEYLLDDEEELLDSSQFITEMAKSMECDVRVICEKEPMLPAPDGEWGVNPQSAAPV